MPLSEHLGALGDQVQTGDDVREVASAKRINAIVECLRALARGENLVQGPGVLITRNNVNAAIMANWDGIEFGTTYRLFIVEIALAANTPPTSAQIDAAILAKYAAKTTGPAEGDIFRISRADDHHPEVEVWLTTAILGPDWRFTPDTPLVIGGVSWYKRTHDISGRVHAEDAASKTTINASGLTITNKTGTKTLVALPADITANMTLRDLPVVFGSEVKLARVIASDPISQVPPVFLPGGSGQSFLPGGGIRFADDGTGTGTSYINVYAPEIALPADQEPASLIGLEYIPATLPNGASGVRLHYYSRIIDNATSRVRLTTANAGVTSYFVLSAATEALLTEVTGHEARIDSLEADLASAESDIIVLANALSDLIDSVDVLTDRVTFLESEIDRIDNTTDSIFDSLIDHGADLDYIFEAVYNASITCDATGVTLVWGHPPPPE